MSISVDELIERLEESLADIERRNYGDAAQRLINTISIIKIDGIWVVVKPEMTKQVSEQNGSEA